MRLHVLVEGQSEEAFVKRVVVPHPRSFGVYADVTIVVTKKLAAGSHLRGGVTCLRQVTDSLRPLSRDSSAWTTTMFDFYGLPNDFPGVAECRALSDPRAAVALLERRFAEAHGNDRFIPFFALHEFEAWIFSSPEAVGEYTGLPSATRRLQQALDECVEPELINHGLTTHPKARLREAFPRYREVSDGPILLESIGLARIRERCPHFAAWLSRLEGLAAES